MSDYDKEYWQAEQAAQEQAQTAYRDKMAKARQRSASNAKRKIARLHAKLTELGHISDFEDEFGESVLDRLEKYGSAFQDLEKGRAGDALSIAQRQVVARMNKKVKDLKAKQKAGETEISDPDADYVRTSDRWKADSLRAGSFKSKRKSGFTPRVRHIEDEFIEADVPPRPINPSPPRLAAVTDIPKGAKPEPYIPNYTPPTPQPKTKGKKRPFLRVVENP
jgi:hypothetical protein